MITQEQMKAEINENFPNILDGTTTMPGFVDTDLGGRDKAIEYIATIGSFLSDKDAMTQALVNLNNDVKNTMGDDAEAALTYYQNLLQYYKAPTARYVPPPQRLDTLPQASAKPQKPTKPTKATRALSKTFAKVEQADGFNFVSQKKEKSHPQGKVTRRDYQHQVFTEIVSTATFQDHLKKKLHWKDPNIPGNHGEYSHRIQWYCIVKNNVVPKKMAPKLFSLLGAIEYPKIKERTLWDCICDRDGGEASEIPFKTADPEDFRSPELLHKFLKASTDTRLELLTAIIKARIAKRATSMGRIQAISERTDGTMFDIDDVD
jgi:hypothetical protein